MYLKSVYDSGPLLQTRDIFFKSEYFRIKRNLTFLKEKICFIFSQKHTRTENSITFFTFSALEMEVVYSFTFLL